MKKTFTAFYSHSLAAGATDSLAFAIRETGNKIDIKRIVIDAEIFNVDIGRYVPWETNLYLGCDLEIGNNEQFATAFTLTTPGAGSFLTRSNFHLTNPGTYIFDNNIFFNEALFTLSVINNHTVNDHTVRYNLIIEAEVTPL